MDCICIAQTNAYAAETTEIEMDNNTRATFWSIFVVIPTTQLIKSDILIQVFAADNIPHIKCLKTFVLCITTFCFFLYFAECFPLWRELTQSQGPISQKHLSECIHRHILYPSTTHKFCSSVGTCKYNTLLTTEVFNPNLKC